MVLTGLLLYNNGIYLDCHILNSHCWCSLRRTKTNFTDQAIVIIIYFIGARPGIVVVVQIALRRARCAPVIQGASRLSIMHLRTQRYGGYGIGHRYCPVNSTEKYFSNEDLSEISHLHCWIMMDSSEGWRNILQQKKLQFWQGMSFPLSISERCL